MTFEEFCKTYPGLLRPDTAFRRMAEEAWREAQLAMRERCERETCFYCGRGVPIDHQHDGKDFHLDSKGCPTLCIAQDIRALELE